MALKITVTIDANPEDLEHVEELILLKEQLRVIDAGYQDMRLQTPEWVIDKMTKADREMKMRVQGELQRRLKAAKARRAALRTADEKRRDLDTEIKDLEGSIQ